MYEHYEKGMAELTREDEPSFRNVISMEHDFFREILEHVGPRIEKQHNLLRKNLEPVLMLAKSLRYFGYIKQLQSFQEFLYSANWKL